MTIEEAQAIIAKTKSPYLKRDMEKFIHKHKKGAGNGKRTKSRLTIGVRNEP